MAMTRTDDVVEIIMLTHRYALAVDRYDPAALLEVFTENAVLDFSALGLGKMDGLGEIAAYFAESRAAGRQAMHRISNHVIEIIGEDTAVGSHYTQAFRPGPDGRQPLVAALVINEDRYVRSPIGWQVSHRAATPGVDISFDF
jgi:hypothetical protein